LVAIGVTLNLWSG